jgi:hypothetical protein
MENNSLHDHLAKVHAELTEAVRADPKSRETLNEMMQDIHGLIDKPADMTASSRGSLPDRLERVAVQFEADHPTLAASARRLVDLLGEVGI